MRLIALALLLVAAVGCGKSGANALQGAWKGNLETGEPVVLEFRPDGEVRFVVDGSPLFNPEDNAQWLVHKSGDPIQLEIAVEGDEPRRFKSIASPVGESGLMFRLGSQFETEFPSGFNRREDHDHLQLLLERM